MNFTKKNLFLFIFFGCFTICAQINKEKEVLKILSFEKAEKLHQQKPKPIVVFLYTDWCEVCFGMKKNTFKNDKVIHLLNDKFYFLKLNAEHQEDISFLGKTFVYKPSGNKTGINELAKELASIDGKISYPTTIILNSNLEIDLQIGSYINSKNMHEILMKFLTLNEN
jgi:thioredoxin-related protein